MTAATTGWFLVRWLAVAYAIESLMIAWRPVGAVGEWLGAGAGPLAVPLGQSPKAKLVVMMTEVRS